jgi:hypothetical protein
VLGKKAEADVGFTLQHLRGDEIGVGMLVHPHLHASVREEPLAKCVGENSERERQTRGDAKLALIEACRGACGLPGVGCGSECCPRAGKHRPSDWRQHDAARASLEQRRTDGCLEYPKLMRQGRLGDEQAICCSRNRACLCDNREVLELSQVERDLVIHREIV